jgi:hypothetical protein
VLALLPAEAAAALLPAGAAVQLRAGAAELPQRAEAAVAELPRRADKGKQGEATALFQADCIEMATQAILSIWHMARLLGRRRPSWPWLLQRPPLPVPKQRTSGSHSARGIHGAFGPFIPAGIRIGLDAKEKLHADPRGLAVTYYNGTNPPCPCVADGVTIATQASRRNRCLRRAGIGCGLAASKVRAFQGDRRSGRHQR